MTKKNKCYHEAETCRDNEFREFYTKILNFMNYIMMKDGKSNNLIFI